MVLSSLNEIFPKRQVPLFLYRGTSQRLSRNPPPFANIEGVSALVSRNPGFLSCGGVAIYICLSIIFKPNVEQQIVLAYAIRKLVKK